MRSQERHKRIEEPRLALFSYLLPTGPDLPFGFADRSIELTEDHAPPATHEEQSFSPTRSKQDKLRYRTGIAIAIVSILGAIVAWRASTVSGAAAGLGQQATTELAEKQQIAARLHNNVNQDLRLLASYQEHLWLEARLRDDARNVRNEDPALANALEVRANGEAVLLRAIDQFFIVAHPDVDPAKAIATYDRARAIQYLADYEPRLAELRPQELAAATGTQQRLARQLVLMGAVLVIALFFLTVAQLPGLARARGFELAGLSAAAVALFLFLRSGAL